MIETPRLLLRPYTPDDFEDYYAYIKDRQLQADLGLEGMDDRDCAIINFQWLMDNREFLALTSRETGKCIGHICVHPPDRVVMEAREFQGKKGASLSFAIAKNKQRKGLMTEALEALVPELFQRDRLDYLNCECTPDNTASAALQARLGFRYWGTEWFEGVELLVYILRTPDREKL